MRRPHPRRRATGAHVEIIRRCAALRKSIPSIRDLSAITGLSDSVVRHISSGATEYKTPAPTVPTD